MEELELREYWTIIRKRMALVLLIPIIAAIVSGLFSVYVIKKQYAAATTLLVNEKPSANQNVSLDTVTTNEALVNTYTAIIKSETLEQAVINKLHLPYTPGQIDGMIKVSSPTQSEVIQVSVTSPSESLAVEIANGMAQQFQKEAYKLYAVENVQIVDPAIAPAHASPVKPNKKLNVAIAFILGLMVSLGIAFLLEYLDNRIRTDEDVERYLKLPVLGAVFDYADGE